MNPLSPKPATRPPIALPSPMPTLTATRETALARWRSSRGASTVMSVDWLDEIAPLPIPARAAEARAVGSDSAKARPA